MGILAPDKALRALKPVEVEVRTRLYPSNTSYNSYARSALNSSLSTKRADLNIYILYLKTFLKNVLKVPLHKTLPSNTTMAVQATEHPSRLWF